MPYYYCSLPNHKNSGLKMAQVVTDDDEVRDAFVRKYDVPGRAVYWCPNPLKDGATRRSLETIARVERLFWDIDYKDLVTPPEEIKARLQQLPVEPTVVYETGGGLHLYVDLKEPIEADDAEMFGRAQMLQKAVASCFSADPAPAHPAALMRWPGSHNSKRGDPILVRPLWGSSKPADVTDYEALGDLLPVRGCSSASKGPNKPTATTSLVRSRRAARST